MKILSEASYERLSFNPALPLIEAQLSKCRLDNRELHEKNTRLAARCRWAESRIQELTLLLGFKGFAVEIIPEVPAKPAQIALVKFAKT